MRIFINTLGSRGDVQPYVALGKGLRAGGHEVTVCTSARFTTFIREHGLAYGHMTDELLNLIDSDAGRDAMENTTNMLAWVGTARRLATQVGPLQRQMLRDSWAAAVEAAPDVVIYHPKAFGGPHIAEKLGVPAIVAVPLPAFVPTAEFPNLLLPAWKLGGWYNRLTYTLTERLTVSQLGKFVREWRAEHGLPPAGRGAGLLHTSEGAPIPVLHAYSRHVAPEPSDWPEGTHATGYWFLERPGDWEPPAALQAFLDAGEPPVYVGFGSMAGRDPARITGTVVAALQEAGVRGLIATGWGGLATGELPETILKIDAAPHDWLFPRVAAVVHHGGAGTTAAGLRAGRPTLVCPFFGDQPFWGRRVHALGAGPAPIPQKRLTVPALAGALRALTGDPALARAAAAVGEKLRAEDGVARAVRLIEAYAG